MLVEIAAQRKTRSIALESAKKKLGGFPQPGFLLITCSEGIFLLDVERQH